MVTYYAAPSRYSPGGSQGGPSRGPSDLPSVGKIVSTPEGNVAVIPQQVSSSSVYNTPSGSRTVLTESQVRSLGGIVYSKPQLTTGSSSASVLLTSPPPTQQGLNVQIVKQPVTSFADRFKQYIGQGQSVLGGQNVRADDSRSSIGINKDITSWISKYNIRDSSVYKVSQEKNVGIKQEIKNIYNKITQPLRNLEKDYQSKIISPQEAAVRSRLINNQINKEYQDLNADILAFKLRGSTDVKEYERLTNKQLELEGRSKELSTLQSKIDNRLEQQIVTKEKYLEGLKLTGYGFGKDVVSGAKDYFKSTRAIPLGFEPVTTYRGLKAITEKPQVRTFALTSSAIGLAPIISGGGLAGSVIGGTLTGTGVVQAGWSGYKFLKEPTVSKSISATIDVGGTIAEGGLFAAGKLAKSERAITFFKTPKTPDKLIEGSTTFIRNVEIPSFKLPDIKPVGDLDFFISRSKQQVGEMPTLTQAAKKAEEARSLADVTKIKAGSVRLEEGLKVPKINLDYSPSKIVKGASDVIPSVGMKIPSTETTIKTLSLASPSKVELKSSLLDLSKINRKDITIGVAPVDFLKSKYNKLDTSFTKFQKDYDARFFADLAAAKYKVKDSFRIKYETPEGLKVRLSPVDYAKTKYKTFEYGYNKKFFDIVSGAKNKYKYFTRISYKTPEGAYVKFSPSAYASFRKAQAVKYFKETRIAKLAGKIPKTDLWSSPQRDVYTGFNDLDFRGLAGKIKYAFKDKTPKTFENIDISRVEYYDPITNSWQRFTPKGLPKPQPKLQGTKPLLALPAPSETERILQVGGFKIIVTKTTPSSTRFKPVDSFRSGEQLTGGGTLQIQETTTDLTDSGRFGGWDNVPKPTMIIEDIEQTRYTGKLKDPFEKAKGLSSLNIPVTNIDYGYKGVGGSDGFILKGRNIINEKNLLGTSQDLSGSRVDNPPGVKVFPKTFLDSQLKNEFKFDEPQKLKLGQKFRFDQPQRQRQKQELILIKKPKIDIPNFEDTITKPVFKRKKVKRREYGFDVWTRRFGKPVRIGKSLFKGEALAFGVKETKRTARASFWISPTGESARSIGIKPLREFDVYKQRFRPQIRKGKIQPSVNIFVQERGSRMGSRAEREDITQNRRFFRKVRKKTFS